MSEQPQPSAVIRIAAPATTANLGPGYDCLGMALDIWNTIQVEPQPRALRHPSVFQAREQGSWSLVLKTWFTGQ